MEPLGAGDLKEKIWRQGTEPRKAFPAGTGLEVDGDSGPMRCG
jgi:hypothetical protein